MNYGAAVEADNAPSAPQALQYRQDPCRQPSNEQYRMS